MTATASGGSYMWLLSLVQEPIKCTFGVELPLDDISTSISTTAVSMTVSKTGLEQVSIGLSNPAGGVAWYPSSLLQRVGVSWTGADDLLALYAPSVTYTTLPQSLQVTALVDIKALQASV